MKIISYLIVLLIMIGSAMACYPGATCQPNIDTFTINPCIEDSINSTTNYKIQINSSACPLPYDDYCAYLWQQLCSGTFGFYTNACNSPTFCNDIIISDDACDNVSTRITMYYNTANQSVSAWQTGGSLDTKTFTGTFDGRTGDFTIFIETSTPTVTLYDVQTINFTLSDDSTATNFGDCSGGVPVVDVEQRGNYSIPATFNGFDGGWTGGVLWLIFMVFIGGAIMFISGSATRGGTDTFGIALGITAFVELILVFIGVYFSLISWLWIVFFIIIFGVFVWTKIRSIFGGD